MKIYFSGSIRGGRDDQKLYEKIIMLLSAYGDVLTEHVGDEKTKTKKASVTDKKIYSDDMEKLEKAHVLVAEVTTPSLGVGYEIAQAEGMCKPILCVYRKGAQHSLSAMIAGNPDIETQTYKTIDELGGVFEDFFSRNSAQAKQENEYCCGGGCCQVSPLEQSS